MTSAAHEPVRVAAAGMAIPHPEKVTKQKGVNQQGSGHAGEDSYFFCEGRCVEEPRRQCRRRGSMSQGGKDQGKQGGVRARYDPVLYAAGVRPVRGWYTLRCSQRFEQYYVA